LGGYSTLTGRTVKQAVGVPAGNGPDPDDLEGLAADALPVEVGADGPAATVYEVRFEVEANYEGWRLDRYLCDKIRRLSRTKVQRVIREDLIYRGPGRLKASTPVTAGLEFWLRRRRDPEPDCPRDFRVAYEDRTSWWWTSRPGWPSTPPPATSTTR
jgi:hypothetical protein